MCPHVGSCVDDTVAGIWARAKAATRPPPFTKILLSKLLLLSDRKTRMDYFRQQAEFFKAEGQKDEYAEFSTSIDGKSDTKSHTITQRLGLNLTIGLVCNSRWLSTSYVGCEIRGYLSYIAALPTSPLLGVHIHGIDAALSRLVCATL